MQPLKLTKVNIRSEERLKLASIGDYWDEQMMCENTIFIIFIVWFPQISYFKLS